VKRIKFSFRLNTFAYVICSSNEYTYRVLNIAHRKKHMLFETQYKTIIVVGARISFSWLGVLGHLFFWHI